MRRGDAAVLGAARDLQTTLPLPDGADPWDILALADGALVADPVAKKIYRFDGAGVRMPDFGGAAIDNYLKPARDERKRMARLRPGGLSALLVCLVALASLTLWLRKRRIQEILRLPKG